MAVNLDEPGELLPVSGVTLAAASAQVKRSIAAEQDVTRDPNQEAAGDDLALVALAEGSTVAGVFTQSGFAAPPVTMCREHLASGAGNRAFMVNSGNANAATGVRGLKDAQSLAATVANALNLQPDQVLPFSTGVIGEFLPVERMAEGFKTCADNLREDNWLAAARAIMTTDTLPKAVSRKVHVAGKPVTITGMSKGAGMMRPDMATMLAFIACDAAVDRSTLQTLVRDIADASFNRLTVDGDTSTNDSFVLACTGKSAATPITSANGAGYAELRAGLLEVAVELAQAIVRDGEGATKFVTVRVTGGRTQTECAHVAFTVAHSPLVKTAIFAGDPNWGRFCMAIGKAELSQFDQSKVTLHLDEVCIAQNGLVDENYREADAAAVMAKPEYLALIDLGRGAAQDEVWTSDLSYEYVRINAEYRT